jgi:hypothetical protein
MGKTPCKDKNFKKKYFWSITDDHEQIRSFRNYNLHSKAHHSVTHNFTYCVTTNRNFAVHVCYTAIDKDAILCTIAVSR